MARFRVPCGIHEDWPCCGCDEAVLTGQDALDVCCPYCDDPGCYGGCQDWDNDNEYDDYADY